MEYFRVHPKELMHAFQLVLLMYTENLLAKTLRMLGLKYWKVKRLLLKK